MDIMQLFLNETLISILIGSGISLTSILGYSFFVEPRKYAVLQRLEKSKKSKDTDSIIRELKNRNNQLEVLLADEDIFDRELSRSILLETALYGRINEIEEGVFDAFEKNPSEFLSGSRASNKGFIDWIKGALKKGKKPAGDFVKEKLMKLLNGLLGGK